MNTTRIAVDLGLIAILVAGIARFRTPRGARWGNHAAGLALLAASIIVLARSGVSEPWVVAVSCGAGGLAGLAMAFRAGMTSIPSVIAFQHGMGGIAAVLISIIELTGGTRTVAGTISALFGLVLGAATFSASLLAAAKLGNRVKQAPLHVRGHNAILAVLLLLVVLLAERYRVTATPMLPIAGVAAASAVFGLLFAARIGGADMPVLISLLNATAGFAAAFCGVTIENRLLIVAGATVASSGSILTIMMCRAMNRSLANIFFGGPNLVAAPPAIEPAREPDSIPFAQRVDLVVAAALAARKVIVVPGYGMALAQAQIEVVRLGKVLEDKGKEVHFAIHPVAGRMPGHMNVLLAEADVDYEKLVEIEDANRAFPETDLVLVVGACDVVNPAALDVEGTPLSGMPILMAHQARAVAVCNLDEKPGYSGVANPLYRAERTHMLLGDALGTVTQLRERLESAA
jgi:NAD(P) transhydrogenase subunit beta